MEWPQIVFIVLYTINVLIAGLLHGKTTSKKHSFFATAIGSGLGIWVLHMGGFWS